MADMALLSSAGWLKGGQNPIDSCQMWLVHGHLVCGIPHVADIYPAVNFYDVEKPPFVSR